MHRLLIAAIALVALVAPAVASAKTSILYSASAGSASISAGHVTLPAKAATSWFTDRPERRAGQTTLGSFAELWRASGFDRTPPNAALVTTRSGASMTTVVTLTSPRRVGADVRFRYRVLKHGSAMGMRTTGAPKAGNYGRTELFIDGAADPPCSYSLNQGQSCLFDVANGAYSYLVAPGGYVLVCSVGTQATGLTIVWYSLHDSFGIADKNTASDLSPPLCPTTASYGAGSAYARTDIRLTRGNGPSGVVRVTSTS